MTQAGEVIDLLVLGAGMAGLSAAAKAASEGASVVLVEKGEAIGGSAAYAGFIWTAPTVEVMREVNPDGDPALGRRIVEGYDDALAFVRSLGVARRRPGHRARLRARAARPTWRTSCSPATASCASAARCWCAATRAGCSRRTVPSSAPRSRRPRGTRTDPRAQHAARHRRLRRRPRPARRAHRARGAGPPAAREPQQHRRRPAPRPRPRAPPRASPTPASTAT